MKVQRVENTEDGKVKIFCEEKGIKVTLTVSDNKVEVFSNNPVKVSPQQAVNSLWIMVERRESEGG